MLCDNAHWTKIRTLRKNGSKSVNSVHQHFLQWKKPTKVDKNARNETSSALSNWSFLEENRREFWFWFLNKRINQIGLMFAYFFEKILMCFIRQHQYILLWEIFHQSSTKSILKWLIKATRIYMMSYAFM